MRAISRFISCFVFPACLLLAGSIEGSKPNIVIIYADDMGFGDLNCQNPESKIPTPHLDKLASEGMRFTDGHSSSGICSPSRFALLTGQYHWRRRHGIVGGFGESFFTEGDVTLPQLLNDNGYATACIGKWHLGWDWKEHIKNPPSQERTYWDKKRPVYAPEDIDWTTPLTGGPLDWGFDYYFGDGTINFPPYVWVENDRFLDSPTVIVEFDGFAREAKEGGWDSRPGPAVEGWDPYQVLPTLTRKSVEWIEAQDKKKPFFLYFPLPSPHMPVIPNDEFDGKSEAGAYGDFVYQSDWVAGQVLKALKRKGFEKNTIVIFTADNGAEQIAFDRAQNYGHFSSGQFRGLKRDIWEGGHRVPFIVKWPGVIEAGTVSDEVVSQIDIMATVSEITGIELPEGSAQDSYNLLPLWKGNVYKKPLREATVQNTRKDQYALRKGKWLYMNESSGEISKMPDFYKQLRNYKDFETEGLLFDLEKDPGQRTNLYDKYPELVKEMENTLSRYRESDSSVAR
ncbi:MAG: arylsulfatase [Puniceicoccaceae bacterium]